jgi:Tol biopolymer transport system component
VWSVDADGGETSHLYRSECCISDWGAPVWSPDGRCIAFFVELLLLRGAGTHGVDDGTFVMNADGTNLRQVKTLSSSGGPAWQPIP